MNSRAASDVAQTNALVDQMPGAVPPTGGVPAEDAGSVRRSTERSAADDLVDGLDLLTRAARRLSRSLAPELEASAQRAMARLQEFDSDASAMPEESPGVDPTQLQELAASMGKEVVTLVERFARAVESARSGTGR